MVAKVFSAYDERPDPKGPGQQGVLFRKVAPAQNQDKRQHLVPEEQSQYAKSKHIQPELKDERLLKGRATGMVPEELYHGTSARLKPGSLITPGRPGNYPGQSTGGAAAHGKTMDENHEHVFAATELHHAYSAAKVAQENKVNNGSTSARPHVYRVQPTGPVQIDAEDADTRAGYSDSAEAFQSKKPLRVMNEVQFADAKESYRSEMEDEQGYDPGAYPFAPKVKQEEMW